MDITLSDLTLHSFMGFLTEADLNLKMSPPYGMNIIGTCKERRRQMGS